MSLEAILNRPDIHRVVLEEQQEGVYVLGFDSKDAPGPFHDQLQDDWAMAKRNAFRKWGITEEMWRDIGRTDFLS